MKRIGIVLHPYSDKVSGGLDRYAFEITNNLLQQSLGSGREFIIYIKGNDQRDPEFNTNNYKIERLKPGLFWIDRGLLKNDLDMCIFYTPVTALFARVGKIISVVHDLAYKYNLERNLKTRIINFLMGFVYKKSIKRSDHVVTVSNKTKNDVIKYFNKDEKDISVVYNGARNICESNLKEINLPDKFFCYVGALKHRKNVKGIIEAFNIFKKDDKSNTKLVLTGNKGGKHFEELSELIKKYSLEEDVIFIGRIDDEEMAYLYSKTLALIYPSYLEGFGMTILEAMKCGVPIIASDLEVFKEVFGENILMSDPDDYENMAKNISRIAFDSEFRRLYIERSLSLSEKYSWENSAKDFLKLIEKYEK